MKLGGMIKDRNRLKKTPCVCIYVNMMIHWIYLNFLDCFSLDARLSNPSKCHELCCLQDPADIQSSVTNLSSYCGEDYFHNL